MIDIERYNSISTTNSNFTKQVITPFLPSPKEKDYRRGYIIRYFVKLATNSQSPIYEVNSNSFTSISANPLYVTTNLDWRLSGGIDDVRKSNKISVRLASQTIPQLNLYLPNYLQFYNKNFQRI